VKRFLWLWLSLAWLIAIWSLFAGATSQAVEWLDGLPDWLGAVLLVLWVGATGGMAFPDESGTFAICLWLLIAIPVLCAYRKRGAWVLLSAPAALFWPVVSWLAPAAGP
jgi:hypothetical protein